ncbi:MAG: hypothetical protein R3B93_08970 [Bacteroidia bacterium]
MADLHIEIKSIGFNYDLFGNSNAFPLFDNGNNENDEKRLITAPEWDTDPERIRNDPAAYAIGHKITMKVELGITGFNKDIDRREIIIKASGEKYGVKPKSFHLNDKNLIEDNCIKGQILEFTHVFDKVGIYEFTLNWECTDVGKCQTFSIGETEHKFFILLDTPKAPMHFPNWVQVLEKVCCWACGKGEKEFKEAAINITQKFKKEYQFRPKGSNNFMDSKRMLTKNLTESLFLQAFLELAKESIKSNYCIKVDCYDIAFILSAFFRAIGIQASIICLKGSLDTVAIKEIGSPLKELKSQNYDSHCLIEAESLWYDGFIDRIGLLEPIAIPRCEYIKNLLNNPNGYECKYLIKNKIYREEEVKNFYIQYLHESQIKGDVLCNKEVNIQSANNHFTKNTSIGWSIIPSNEITKSEIHFKKLFEGINEDYISELLEEEAYTRLPFHSNVWRNRTGTVEILVEENHVFLRKINLLTTDKFWISESWKQFSLKLINNQKLYRSPIPEFPSAKERNICKGTDINFEKATYKRIYYLIADSDNIIRVQNKQFKVFHTDINLYNNFYTEILQKGENLAFKYRDYIKVIHRFYNQ